MNKIITLENLETFAEINDTLKADKDVLATTGNLAKFDENGNPVDSGININDLSYPSVGNAEIEIQKNGTKINSFTTNQSGSKVAINITVPTGTAADKNVPSSGDASSTQVVLGNDSRLSNSRPASDVYSWAKASTKPTYIANEVMSISIVAISANKSSSCSITGSSNAGKAQTIIYTNSKSADYTVTVPTTYKTPDGAAIELTCPKNGYCEVSYLNISGTIYARGL